MGDMTEEEFNSLPTDSQMSEADFNSLPADQMSEADFNALPLESAQQVAPVEQPEQSNSSVNAFLKNLSRIYETFYRGMAGRGEEAAAGVAGMLYPQRNAAWQEKIDNQNQWIKENADDGAAAGKFVSDLIVQLPALLAAPEVAGSALIKPFKQVLQDMGTSGFTGMMTHPGDTWDRLNHGAFDAAGAGIFSSLGQAAKPAIKYFGKGIRNVHDIFTDAGHMSKLEEYLQRAVPQQDIQSLVSKLEDPAALVPGAKPTAAEIGQHYGLNTLQKYFSNINPGQYIDRALANIRAESDLLAAVADFKKLPNAMAKRSAITNPLYEAAKRAMVPVNQELVQLLKRPKMRQALNEAIITGADNGITPPTRAMLNQILSGRNGAAINGDAMHHIKLGIDSIINRLNKSIKTPRDKLDLESFNNLRGKFQSWRETNMQEYAQAQAAYRKTSKAVNRRNAGQAIINKVYPHGVEDPAALDSANSFTLGDILKDPDELVKQGTDFAGATFNKVFTKRQRQLMADVSESQRRRQQSELTSGSGAPHEGSGGMESRGVGAIAQAIAPYNMPGVYQGITGRLLSEITGQNRATQATLANILLDPKQTAALFKAPKRSPAMSIMDKYRLNQIPGSVGYLISNQYMDLYNND